jgi:hypothetical protein
VIRDECGAGRDSFAVPGALWPGSSGSSGSMLGLLAWTPRGASDRRRQGPYCAGQALLRTRWAGSAWFVAFHMLSLECSAGTSRKQVFWGPEKV